MTTVSIEPDWVSLAAYFESVLVEAVSDLMVDGFDSRKWVDSALETIIYARSLSKEETE